MTIKPAYLVTDMSCNSVDDYTGIAREKNTERAAIKEATALLEKTTEDEVWIWRLSHVVSRPKLEPDVEKVK